MVLWPPLNTHQTCSTTPLQLVDSACNICHQQCTVLCGKARPTIQELVYSRTSLARGPLAVSRLTCVSVVGPQHVVEVQARVLGNEQVAV